jgi:hypothetical protein
MSEQPTPAEPVEPVEYVAPAEPVQPAVAPTVVTAPAAVPVTTRTRRGWLPYLGVGLAGVLIGIIVTCAAGLLIQVAWGHHGFDGGPGRHAPFEHRRPMPGPGFGEGGPFRR